MLKFLVLGIGLLTSISVFAGVTYDQAGLPRCISNGDRSLLLLWNEDDAYAREILTLDTGTYTPEDSSSGAVYNCQSQIKLGSVPRSYLQPLPKDVKSFTAFDLSDQRLRKGLAQVRGGARQFHEEADGRAYLRKHPISSFTVELNRKLTAQFGTGFASEIYAAYLAQDPNNQALSDMIFRNFRPRASDFQELARNREVLYVKGLGHELASAKKYDVLVDNLRAAGVTVKVVKTNSYDVITKNALVVQAALDAELKLGKNIILVGLSKGGAEALLGLSLLKNKLEGSAKPAGYGKVEAYLGLSGVYAGSFLVDWGSKLPQRLVLSDVLKSEYKKEGKVLPSLDGTLDITTDHVSSVMAQVAKNGLPKGTTYISVIGTLPGDGLAAKGSHIRSLQDDVIRPRLENYGANDGYIEYPGTAVPKRLVKTSYVVNVNASHELIEGNFQNTAMVGAAENVLDAISLSVLQLISK